MERLSLKYLVSLFLLEFCVTLLEFVNTSCCINKLHFPSEERMRFMRNLQFNQRIFISVFPLNRFI